MKLGTRVAIKACADKQIGSLGNKYQGRFLMRRRTKSRRKSPALIPQIDTEAWLKKNPMDLFECPNQPGKLKLTPQACAKRYITANEPRWANIGAEPFPIFVFKMNLIPCRNCETGAQMASQHEVQAA